jgi:Ser/Thr protein kinase RdoA (MazF antagonist)
MAIWDRSTEVFWWQADRKISDEENARIFGNKHAGIDNETIIATANRTLPKGSRLTSIEAINDSFGNVNSVRFGTLESGERVVIRCHPVGVTNGYFWVERLAAEQLRAGGLPAPKFHMVHDCTGAKDAAFQVMQRMPGETVRDYLEHTPDAKNILIFQEGAMMARMHEFKAEGYGPFDNEKAKKGKLVGFHKTFEQSVLAGLDFELDTMMKYGYFPGTADDARKVKQFFMGNPALRDEQPVFVHNDFPDWNIMTDGINLTGILDFDECIAGLPTSDIASYSTFFDLSRMDVFLAGYQSVRPLPKNFNEVFEVLRFRYMLMKMTLRSRRYQYDKRDEFKNKLEGGKIIVADTMKKLGIIGGSSANTTPSGIILK